MKQLGVQFNQQRTSQDSKLSKKSRVSINRENEVTQFQDLVIPPRSNLKKMKSPSGQDRGEAKDHLQI